MNQFEKNKQSIIEAIENIKRIFPNVKNINISYHAKVNKIFESRIELRYGKKIFTASKCGNSIKRSLTSSNRAILKQLEKAINKKIFYKNARVVNQLLI